MNNSNNFFIVDKRLFDGEYKDMSLYEKIAYAAIVDRYSLSEVTGFCDDDGGICVIYTVEELGDFLGCSRQKAGKIMAALVKKNLIKRKKIRKIGSYYLYPLPLRKCVFSADEAGKKKNKTKSKSRESPSKRSLEYDRNQICILLHNKWNYRHISEKGEDYERYAAVIFDIVTDILIARTPTIRIADDIRNTEYVQSVIMRLSEQHIIYIIERLISTDINNIKNLRKYIETALYNSGVVVPINQK